MPVAIWILASLLAIAALGDWETGGLAIAVLGGVAVGLASALEVTPPLSSNEASSNQVRSSRISIFLPSPIRWIGNHSAVSHLPLRAVQVLRAFFPQGGLRSAKQSPPSRVEIALSQTTLLATPALAGGARVTPERLRWIVKNELWILLLLSPLFLFPRREFVLAFLILPALWILRWRVHGNLTRRTPFDWPILLLMLMLSVSILVSADPNESLSKLAGILLGIGVFYAMVNRVNSAGDIDWMVAAIVALEAAIAFFGVLGTRWLASGKFLPSQIFNLLPHVESFPGATKGLFDPNQVGGTLTFIVPFLGVLLAERWKPLSNQTENGWAPRLRSLFLKRWLLIPFALTAFVLLLTQSRSALFGAAISFVVFAAIRWRYFRWALAPIAFLALLFIFSQGISSVGQLLVGQAEERTPVGALDFAGRQEVWQRALYAIQDFPFTGVGLNMFGTVSKILYPYFLISPDVTLSHAHDVYLQVAVDLGVPGFVAYIGLLTAFGYCVWSVYTFSPSPSYRTLALALGMGVLAHQIFGLTDAVMLGAKQGVILWMMLALAAALLSFNRSSLIATDHRSAEEIPD